MQRERNLPPILWFTYRNHFLYEFSHQTYSVAVWICCAWPALFCTGRRAESPAERGRGRKRSQSHTAVDVRVDVFSPYFRPRRVSVSESDSSSSSSSSPSPSPPPPAKVKKQKHKHSKRYKRHSSPAVASRDLSYSEEENAGRKVSFTGCNRKGLLICGVSAYVHLCLFT